MTNWKKAKYIGSKALANMGLAALVLVLASCQREDPNRWTAFVYAPGKSMSAGDVQNAIYGKYPTFESCQAAAISSLDRHVSMMTDEETDDLGMGDYECGSDCSFNEKYGLYMCKETRK